MYVTTSDGCALHYEEVGQGKPVVLIHGTAACIWGGTVGALADRHRVIAYDRRSFGQSLHAPLANLSHHAADAAELVEQIAAEPAVIVGWSIGGVIALELANKHRSLVRGLVLVEPPFYSKRFASFAMLRGVGLGILLGKLGWSRQGAIQFMRWALRHRDGSDGFDALPAAVRDAVLANAPAITSELLGGTGEHLMEAELERLDIPTQILVGTRSDHAFGLAAERLAAVLPRADVQLIEGAGHFLQLDAPSAIAAAVDRFA
jgi:non-heme chloroperoxidase